LRAAESKGKFNTLADIDKPGVKVIANPGGTNENTIAPILHNAEIVIFPNNAEIFASWWPEADLMITRRGGDAVAQKLHPELCAIHPTSRSISASWLTCCRGIRC